MPKIEPIAGYPAPHRMQFVADIPGEFKDMIVHRSTLFVLTSHGLFEMHAGKLVPVPFDSPPTWLVPNDGTYPPK